METPAKPSHAPKGDITPVHAALRLFGRDMKEYEIPEGCRAPELMAEFRVGPLDKRAHHRSRAYQKFVGVPISIELVNELIERIASEYRRRLDDTLRPRLIAAVTNAIGAATSYANALEALAGLAPGYMAHEILKRRPDGGRNDVAVLGVVLPPEIHAPAGDADTAFGPEIALAYEKRPAHILQPSIKRAKALARLLTEQRKTLEGDLKGGVGGHQNTERDGRNAKDTLTEACYLLIAGCFGPPGTAKIKTTSAGAKGREIRAPRLFPALLAAMHRYATRDEIDPVAFDKTVKKIVPAMQQELQTFGAWNYWIMLYSEPAARPMASSMALTFLNRLIDPTAKPPARAAS